MQDAINHGGCVM